MKPAKVKIWPIDHNATEGTDQEAWRLFQELLSGPHDHLRIARFQLVWMLEKKPGRDGHVTYGKASKAPEVWSRLAEVDFVIYLNRDEWARFDHAQEPERMRRYLLDHELCHCGPDIDEDSGEQKTDVSGRLLWRLIKHDLEEFRGPIDRHGLCMADVRAFARTCNKAQRQLPLGDPEEVGGIEEAIDEHLAESVDRGYAAAAGVGGKVLDFIEEHAATEDGDITVRTDGREVRTTLDGIKEAARRAGS